MRLGWTPKFSDFSSAYSFFMGLRRRSFEKTISIVNGIVATNMVMEKKGRMATGIIPS